MPRIRQKSIVLWTCRDGVAHVNQTHKLISAEIPAFIAASALKGMAGIVPVYA